MGVHVPTRWGNQLNGNSVGTLSHKLLAKVPTRWGNQLNGNAQISFLPAILMSQEDSRYSEA